MAVGRDGPSSSPIRASCVLDRPGIHELTFCLYWPGLTTAGGSVLRHVDFPPQLLHAMHRTISIDYGVVLEGEMVCILDSGEEKLLKRGDVCVQRGTMHAWRNPGTEWARMMFVLLPCVPLEVGGEDLGTAVGIRGSD